MSAITVRHDLRSWFGPARVAPYFTVPPGT